MQFIEHIIEPSKLLLAWQSSDETCRTRYVVAELNRIDDKVTLTYLNKSKDFADAQKKGFSSYPAFQDTGITHHNVIDAFLRRLPPRTRGDFPQYLEGLRLKPDAQLSDFALLGYSGARLPNDSFSIIHPFENVDDSCELLLEAAGYKYIHKNHDAPINIGEIVSFVDVYNEDIHEESIRITVGKNLLGYVPRALIPTFKQWIANNRIIDAKIEKKNGVPGLPTVYLFVKVSPLTS